MTLTDEASGDQQPGDNPDVDSDEDNPANYATALYGTDATGCANGTFVLPIELKSEFNVKAFQFDVVLPDGMTFVENNGAYACNPTNRINGGYSVICNSKSGENSDVAQILCSNTSNPNAIISGTNGIILNIPIEIASNVLDGEYKINVCNTTLVMADNTEYKELRGKVFKATITVTSYILGDANNSGEVNVADITAVVSHIYGQTPAIFNHAAADVNSSGEINVADITGIVSIIYGGNASRAKSITASRNEEVTLSVPSVTVSAGTEVNLPIYIDNADAVSAFQFDLSLPENVTVTGVYCFSDVHHCLGAYMENGKYRIMSYSMANEKFINSSAPVAYVTLAIDNEFPSGTYDINISSAYSSSDGKDYVTNTSNAKLTVGDVTGINTIGNDNTIEAITISGIKVNTGHKLPKGIYIINGQKRVK